MMSTLSPAVPTYPADLGDELATSGEESFRLHCNAAAVALAQAQGYYPPRATLTVAKRKPVLLGGSRLVMLRAHQALAIARRWRCGYDAATVAARYSMFAALDQEVGTTENPTHNLVSTVPNTGLLPVRFIREPNERMAK
jgi:hypothetical protein